MSKKNEQKFITELKKSVKLLHETKGMSHFWYKIPDSPHLGTARFDPPKPFDIFYVADSYPYAIEAKSIDGYRAFSLRDMRPSQIENLTDFDMAGGMAYVFLNIRQAASKAEGKEHINKLIIMTWGSLYHRLEQSSIKAKELKEAPFIQGKNGLFDLSGGYKEFDPTLGMEP